MISYDPLLFIGQDRIFLLVACNDNFNAFLQIFLRCIFSVISDRTERRLVDDIGQLSTGCTGILEKINTISVHSLLKTGTYPAALRRSHSTRPDRRRLHRP